MTVARLLAAMISLAAFSAPPAAFAQQIPAASATGETPSYAKPAMRDGSEHIEGRVAGYDGKYALTVSDDRGFIDTVELHQGTIINPTGLRLEPGMRVTIRGSNRGRAFAADQIDTPYQAYGFEYGYPAFGYPYPEYSPFSIGIGFGPEYYHHWH